jgi:hypothetical protein
MIYAGLMVPVEGENVAHVVWGLWNVRGWQARRGGGADDGMLRGSYRLDMWRHSAEGERVLGTMVMEVG